MAIWSSIFGEKQLTPPVPAQQISVSELPKELAPYYKDILSKSQALYEQRMAEDPSLRRFTGATLAEFTPEQQQAFTGIAGLVGSQAPAMAEATEMTRAGAAPITGEQIEEYMSPYQQAVTDIEKREATKQFESQVIPQLAQQAAQSQAFGGSRQAILEGMAADTQQRLLADIQAKGSAQAYQDAVQRLQEQRTRTGQAASQIGNLGTAAYKGAAAELGGLGIVGAAKQQQAQTALDKEYAEWLKQREQPFREMGKYQSMVIGAPLGQTTFEPSKPATFGPSVGQQIIGGLGGLGQLYGQFSGKTLAGTPYQFPPGAAGKTGCGISSLVSRKQTPPGGIGSNFEIDESIFMPRSDPQVPAINRFFHYLGPEGVEGAYKRSMIAHEKQKALAKKSTDYQKSIIEADLANRQFEREQALFKSMAKWGMSPEVTGPEGTTAGMQVSQLLSRIGSDVGEAETKARAKTRESQKDLIDLEMKYNQALAAGDMALALSLSEALKTGAALEVDIGTLNATLAKNSLDANIEFLKLNNVSEPVQKAIKSHAAGLLGANAVFDRQGNFQNWKGKGGNVVSASLATQINMLDSILQQIYNDTMLGKPFQGQKRSPGNREQAIADVKAYRLAEDIDLDEINTEIKVPEVSEINQKIIDSLSPLVVEEDEEKEEE
jgi:truncated hemoglobin YjbI